MKKKWMVWMLVLAGMLQVQARDLTQYVNPLMGTLSSFALSAGNTYPAIARPWGMNFWTPQTGKMGDGWQYVYTAHKIRGFKQTHQPSPWINDYGQFSLMPMVDRPEFDEEKRASWFSHKGEVARPYYYKVYLADYDVLTEFTPTERAVLFRFTFPESEHAYVAVDAFDRGSYVRIEPERNRIVGYSTRNSGGVPDNFRNYFVVEFDKPFTYRATVADSVLTEGKLEQQAGHAGALIGFRTRRGEVVHARVASSFISWEQAERNLQELGRHSFDELAAEGREAWNKVLGRIEVEGGTHTPVTGCGGDPGRGDPFGGPRGNFQGHDRRTLGFQIERGTQPVGQSHVVCVYRLHPDLLHQGQGVLQAHPGRPDRGKVETGRIICLPDRDAVKAVFRVRCRVPVRGQGGQGGQGFLGPGEKCRPPSAQQPLVGAADRVVVVARRQR